MTPDLDAVRAALEWYAEEARACAKNSGNAAAAQALLASVTVLALDGGRRADAALALVADMQRRAAAGL